MLPELPTTDMQMELLADDMSVVHWKCSACGESGTTAPRRAGLRAWSAAVIIEGNHGTGRCVWPNRDSPTR